MAAFGTGVIFLSRKVSASREGTLPFLKQLVYPDLMTPTIICTLNPVEGIGVKRNYSVIFSAPLGCVAL